MKRQPRADRSRPQAGAAIITALVVVTLAAVLVSGLLWRQQVQIRRIENQRLGAQALWVSRGAFDWTRLILRAQADAGPVTYLGGVWDAPIAETRLSDFLGRFAQGKGRAGDQTFLSGRIEDAQARFNLRNLVSVSSGGRAVNEVALGQFAKLLAILGLDGRLAPAVAARMLDALTPPGDAAAARTRPLPPTSLALLDGLAGIDDTVRERLADFVTVLPVPTAVNLNTTTPEVLAALVPALPVAAAQGLLATREQAFFLNIGDAQARLQRFAKDATLYNGSCDVSTNFFFVHGKVRHERAELTRTALIYRDPRTHATQLVAVDES